MNFALNPKSEDRQNEYNLSKGVLEQTVAETFNSKQLYGGARRKVRESPKSLRFILCEPRMTYLPICVRIHPIVVVSVSKRWTDQHCFYMPPP